MSKQGAWVGLAVFSAFAAYACGDDGSSSVPDAAPETASTVFEHLVEVGSWTFGPRIQHPDCPECYSVVRWDLAQDGSTLTTTSFFDVAPSLNDPINPDGKVDGDEACVTVFSLKTLEDGGLNLARRSAIEFKLESSTCVDATGATLPVLLDASEAIGAVSPSLVTSFPPLSGSLLEAWPGFQESGEDTHFASLLTPCKEADWAPGREYCMPTCDFPAASSSRPLCEFPSFDTEYPACHMVANEGAPVGETNIAEDLPTGAGGTLIDGTYRLTAWKVYTGSGGATGTTGQTASAEGALVGDQVSLSIERGSGNHVQANYTLLDSSNQVIVTQTCPAYDGEPIDSFTASGDQLLLFDTLTKRALEFTRLP